MVRCGHQATCCTHPDIGGLVAPNSDCVGCKERKPVRKRKYGQLRK